MLNDNVIPFTPSKQREVKLTQAQRDYLEDMYTDLELTFGGLSEAFSQSEFAHGMIVILLDSEGQVYVDACGTDKLKPKMKQMSTWMEAFNDLHYESDETEEVSS